MLVKCMTPGCQNFAAPADVLCPACRQQSNNSAVGVDFFALETYDAFHDDEPALADDLAKIAGWLVNDQNQRETVIRRQQTRLALREKIIRKLTHHRDDALDQATAERARADGLQEQIEGLHAQITVLQAELDQLYDLSHSNGKRKPGLAMIDTAPGDYSPEYLGYHVLWTRVDPATGREVLWRWYRVDGAGG